MKIKTYVLLLFTLLLSAPIVRAEKRVCEKCGGPTGHKMGAEMGHERGDMPMLWEKVSEELELTSEQKEKIRDQQHENKKAMIQSRTDLRLKNMDLKHELGRKKMDEKKINSLIDDITALNRSVLERKVNSLKEMKQILTEEQWQKLQELKSQKPERHDKNLRKKRKRSK